jgi:hypothetical protein
MSKGCTALWHHVMEVDDEGKRGKAGPPKQEGGGKRPAVSVKDDLLGDIEFDLIDEEVDTEDTINDVFARDTAIPAPAEHLSGPETLRPFEEEEAEAAPPRPRQHAKAPPAPPIRPMQLTPITMEPPAEDLEFDSFDPPVDVFGLPVPSITPAPRSSPRPAFGQSEMPTAPPMAHRNLLEQAKRSMPAPERERRPAFMTATARNAPADLERLARATRPGASSANGRAAQIPTPEPAKDSALDFVDGFDPLLDSLPPPMSGLEAPAPPSTKPPSGPKEMQECYAVGDFSRALSIAEDILARTPDDAAARRCAQNCRDVLTQMFAARIGPLDQVITVVVSPDEIQWLALDHRAGFLLSLVDGQSTVDEILDISGMTRLDALKIIFDLTERQVVRLA